MNGLLSKYGIAGMILLALLVSGFWLSHSGKPYRAVPFNLHKFIALGTVIFVIITVSRLYRSQPLQGPQVLAIVGAAVCFAALFITGGLLSALKSPPGFVLKLHQVIPYLAALSSAASVYLLYR